MLEETVANVLMVTTMVGAENLAALISREADVRVHLARSRRAALGLLRRDEFAVVVIDSSMSPDEVTRELIWQRLGLATPMEINLSITGGTRLLRLVSSVLARRKQEAAMACRAAISAIEDDLRSQVTGLLLQSDLLLRDKSISPHSLQKVKTVRALADNIRSRLRYTQEIAAARVNGRHQGGLGPSGLAGGGSIVP